ncbi:hypothetical protein BGX24_010841, partial [Mortierella sp. AD032]
PAAAEIEALVVAAVSATADAPTALQKTAEKALMTPKVVMLMGSLLPLFERRYVAAKHRFIDYWDPKPLLRASAVCTLWHNILTPVIWRTYDLAIMEKKVPFDVLARNIIHVRNLSLLDRKHEKNAALWEAIKEHGHIDRLEVHEAIFPVKKLMGPEKLKLSHLKLSGNATRMHPFLLIFVERQVLLKSLELTRFKFTPSDWNRVVTKKPHLRKLVIGRECYFLDKESFEGEDDIKAEEKGVNKTITRENDNNQVPAQNPNAMEVDGTPATKGGGSNTKRKGDNNENIGANRTVKKRRRRNRVKDVNTPRPNAKKIGKLPITHLVLLGKRLLLPFQQAILEACPHLYQLDICCFRKADGGKVAALVRDNCREIRRLTLRSSRQPWTLAMIEGMPMSVEELILFTAQLDRQMTSAIKDRADALKRLDLDFGRGNEKGKCRLACVLYILRKCSELREFTYHDHANDKIFKETMFRKPWSLPHLNKLNLHGITPRGKHGGLPQVAVPHGWGQDYGCCRGDCCSARTFEDVHRQGKTPMSPLFDVDLLNHVKNLPQLSQVTITEAIYRKQLE